MSELLKNFEINDDDKTYDDIRRGDALIRHYLNIESPPVNIEQWAGLVNQLLWIEKRKIRQQAELLATIFGKN